MHKLSNRRLLPKIAERFRRFWTAQTLGILNCWQNAGGGVPLVKKLPRRVSVPFFIQQFI